MSQKQVNIGYRDCKIMYEVDRMSVAKMAEHYDIEWADMKKCLRQYGFVIRKGEPQPEEPTKAYTVNLIDTDKIVKEPDVVTVH